MEKITIAFYPDRFEKLKINAKQKHISINQYVRDLVDIGLRVEEAASKNDGKSDANSISEKLDNLQNFIKKHMTSSYETLYLSRYIVSKTAEKNEGENNNMLEKAKDRSASFVDGLFSKE